MKRNAAAIALVIIFMLFNGCNSSTEEKKENSSSSGLLGKWYSVKNPNHTLEFFQDNTLQLNGRSEFKNIGGNWLLLNDGRLKIEITGFMGGKAIEIASINGDRLIATEDSNEIEKEYFKITNNCDYFPLKEGSVFNYVMLDSNNGQSKIVGVECMKGAVGDVLNF